MLRLKTTSLILVLLTLSKGYGQGIANPFLALKEKGEIIYGLDNRRTHIKRDQTVIYGLYLGFGFGKKLRYKLEVSGTPFEVGRVTDINGISTRSRLLFFSLGEEFDFYHFKKFGITTYLQAGVGNNFYKELDINGVEIKNGSELIIPIETGLHFSYELKSYLTLKTGFGWRFILPTYSKDLSGYYVKFGLGFNLKKFKDTKAIK